MALLRRRRHLQLCRRSPSLKPPARSSARYASSARTSSTPRIPRKTYLLFRWLNALHIQTRPSVINDALLFKSGDALSVRVIEETERLLLP